MENIEVYEDSDGEWRFRVKADNGEIVAVSEGYSVQASAYRGAETLKRVLNADPGVTAIAQERGRAIVDEGYRPEFDLGREDQLLDAAYCYLEVGRRGVGFDLRAVPMDWPWHEVYWKPSDRLRNLEKAGGLLAAAITAIKAEEANE